MIIAGFCPYASRIFPRGCVNSGKCFYRPQRSWGKVMFLQVCVILFTGGVPDQVPPQTRYTPQDQVHPPGPGTPPRPVTPPWTRYTPPEPGTPPDHGDTVYVQAVCILLECILVFSNSFTQNCMTMKECRPQEGTLPWHPLGSANGCLNLKHDFCIM